MNSSGLSSRVAVHRPRHLLNVSKVLPRRTKWKSAISLSLGIFKSSCICDERPRAIIYSVLFLLSETRQKSSLLTPSSSLSRRVNRFQKCNNVRLMHEARAGEIIISSRININHLCVSRTSDTYAVTFGFNLYLVGQRVAFRIMYCETFLRGSSRVWLRIQLHPCNITRKLRARATEFLVSLPSVDRVRLSYRRKNSTRSVMP